MSDPRLGLPSASSFEILVNCVGQPQLKEQLRADGVNLNESDEYAIAGSAVHLARQTGDTSALDQEQTELFQKGMEFERLLVERWAAQYDIQAYHEGPREERLFLHNRETLEVIGSGQLDVQWLSDDGKHVAIIDWKLFLAPHSPPAIRNWQVRFQAVAKWRDVDGIETIRAAVNRCMAKVGAEDYVDFSLTDLQNIETEIYFHLWRSRQPDAPRTPGNHCHFCPCRAYCPESGAYALLPGVVAAQGRTVTRENTEELVSTLSHKDLLKLWNADTVVRRVLDAVDARLKTFPKEDLEKLGLELPELGRRMSTITNVQGAIDFLVQSQGLSAEDLWKALKLTQGEVAKLYAVKNNVAEKWAMRAVAELLEPYTTVTNAAPSLKRLKNV